MVNRVLQAKVFKMKRRGKHRTFSKARVKQTVNKERMQFYYHDKQTFQSQTLKDALRGEAPVILQQLELNQNMGVRAPKAMHKVLVDDKVQYVALHFDSKMTCFVFVTINHLHQYTQESIEYSNVDRANEVWSKNKVVWKTPQYISTQTSPVA